MNSTLSALLRLLFFKNENNTECRYDELGNICCKFY